MYNESRGKHLLINNNPIVRYVNPNIIRDTVLPPLIQSSSNFRMQSGSVHLVNQLKSQFNVKKKDILQTFYLEGGVNFRVYILIRKEVPFAPGFIKIRKLGIIIGINKKDISSIQFTEKFSLIQSMKNKRIFQLSCEILIKRKFLKKRQNQKLKPEVQRETVIIYSKSVEQLNLIIKTINYFYLKLKEKKKSLIYNNDGVDGDVYHGTLDDNGNDTDNSDHKRKKNYSKNKQNKNKKKKKKKKSQLNPNTITTFKNTLKNQKMKKKKKKSSITKITFSKHKDNEHKRKRKTSNNRKTSSNISLSTKKTSPSSSLSYSSIMSQSPDTYTNTKTSTNTNTNTNTDTNTERMSISSASSINNMMNTYSNNVYNQKFKKKYSKTNPKPKKNIIISSLDKNSSKHSSSIKNSFEETEY